MPTHPIKTTCPASAIRQVSSRDQQEVKQTPIGSKPAAAPSPPKAIGSLQAVGAPAVYRVQNTPTLHGTLQEDGRVFRGNEEIVNALKLS